MGWTTWRAPVHYARDPTVVMRHAEEGPTARALHLVGAGAAHVRHNIFYDWIFGRGPRDHAVR